MTATSHHPGAEPAPAQELHFGFAKLPDKLTLHFAAQGTAAGTPVLFVHGYADSWNSFRLLLPFLGNAYRLLAPDLRGHGQSGKPPAGYSRRQFAEDLLAFLDRQGLGRVILIGHSLGALIAQHLAARHPERVEKLILIGGAATASTSKELKELQKIIHAFTKPPERAFIRDFQTSTAATLLDPKFLESVIDASARVPLAVWQETLAELTDAAGDARLEAIRSPTLVVWGEADAVFSRAEQEALTSRIPGAVLRTYGGVGHAPHWERPEAVARDIRSFLEGDGTVPLRIAVATRRGHPGLTHFGRADVFQIYEGGRETGGAFTLVAERPATPPCHGLWHDHDALAQAAGVIRDCAALVTNGAGPAAIERLVERRIYPYVVESNGEADLHDAFSRLRDRLTKNRYLTQQQP